MDYTDRTGGVLGHCSSLLIQILSKALKQLQICTRELEISGTHSIPAMIRPQVWAETLQECITHRTLMQTQIMHEENIFLRILEVLRILWFKKIRVFVFSYSITCRDNSLYWDSTECGGRNEAILWIIYIKLKLLIIHCVVISGGKFFWNV